MATTDYTTQITNAFKAILRTSPTSSDIASWNSTLNNGVANVASMISALELSPLGQITEDVVRLYQSVLNRAPDAAGLDFWVAQVKVQGLDAVSGTFITPGSFRRNHANHHQQWQQRP